MNNLNEPLPDLFRRAIEDLEPESTDLAERGLMRGLALRRRRTARRSLTAVGAVLATAGVAIGGWILRARRYFVWEQDPAIVDGAIVVVAIALLTVHLASAYAGQVPPSAALARGLLRSWLIPAGIAVLVVPVAVVMTDQVQGRDIRPSMIITAGGLLAVVACAGYAARLARLRRLRR